MAAVTTSARVATPARLVASSATSAASPSTRPSAKAAVPKAVLSASSSSFSGERLQSAAPRIQPVYATTIQNVASAPVKESPAPQGTKTKKVAVITGASSGLGLNTAVALAKSGDWHIVMACRDFPKAVKAAEKAGLSKDEYTVMHLDLASLESVRVFVKNFQSSGMPLDALVCNAAVYLPLTLEPEFSADGYELAVATNHLGHFLLANLLLDDLAKSTNPNKRMVIVGSVTGNTNTLAGQIPPKADLGNLSGFEAGFRNIAMMNGGPYEGPKAYKDSKVANMMTMREFHRRYHEKTGVTFASLYPGCIADTPLFRNHNSFFRWFLPFLQKNITKGYVSEIDAGIRLADVVSNPKYQDQSGVYWAWRQAGDSLGSNYLSKSGDAYANEPSDEVADDEKAARVWDLSMKLVGLA